MRQPNRGALSAKLMAIVAGAALAGGCDEYLHRRDTMTLGAGDAIATNKATQTINRWPRAAYQDRWVVDGERARLAVHRYRIDEVKNPKALDAEAVKSEPEQAQDPSPGGANKPY